MIVLAVLLLLVVALVVLFVVVTGITPTVSLEWSQINTEVTLTALALFLLGAVTLLVAEAGLAMLLRGNRKNWERRRELKRLRRVEAERVRHEGPTGSAEPARSGADGADRADRAVRTQDRAPATTPAAADASPRHGGAEPGPSGSTRT